MEGGRFGRPPSLPPKEESSLVVVPITRRGLHALAEVLLVLHELRRVRFLQSALVALVSAVSSRFSAFAFAVCETHLPNAFF